MVEREQPVNWTHLGKIASSGKGRQKKKAAHHESWLSHKQMENTEIPGGIRLYNEK